MRPITCLRNALDSKRIQAANVKCILPKRPILRYAYSMEREHLARKATNQAFAVWQRGRWGTPGHIITCRAAPHHFAYQPDIVYRSDR